MATAERILQIERGIVSAMEREVRTMLLQKEREKELARHREAMVRKHLVVEERKKEDHDIIIQEHAIKAVKAQERKERVLANIEEDKMIMAANEAKRKERAIVKQERIAAEREAVTEKQRAEREAKREYIRQVRENLEHIKEQRKVEVWARLKVHDDQCKKVLEKKELDMQERARREVIKDKKTAERREAFRIYQEEIKQQTEERLKKKHIQSTRLQEKKQADLRGLEKMKEEMHVKKREMQDIMKEAERTGDVQKISDELEKLKAHQKEMEERAHQEWAESHLRNSGPGRGSPARLRARSATTSPATTVLEMPMASVTPTPVTPGFTRRGGMGSPVEAERRAVSSDARSKDVPAPGTHYAHLMGLFKARLKDQY